jgi:hypothetical protein
MSIIQQGVISNLFANVMNRMKKINIILNVTNAISLVTEDDMTIEGETTVFTVRTAILNASSPYYENTEFETLFYDTINNLANYARGYTYYSKIDAFNAVLSLIDISPFDDELINEMNPSLPIDSEALYDLQVEINTLKKQLYANMMITINNIISCTKLNIPISNLMKTIKLSVVNNLADG